MKYYIRQIRECTRSRKPNNVGMSLAINRSLLEANGGQLWVDPHEGPGATFHLTLPIAT